MTATGSHIDFGFAARSTTLQGKALALCKFSNIRPRVADIFGLQNPPCWKNFRREG